MTESLKIVIQDVLTRHRSTGEPVHRLLQELARKRGLGSRERKQAGDQIFEQLRTKPWPAWFTQRLQKQYGSEAQALEKALRTRARPCLAVDTRVMTREQAIEQLASRGIACKPSELAETAICHSGLDPESSLDPGSRAWVTTPVGCWWMDEGSQYIVAQVDAKPGEQVLDLCAGAGGKTRLLAATGAEITALDINAKRLAHLDHVHRIVADGRKFKGGPFDKILIDAPCSGTGTLRHAPDLFGRLQESDLPRYVLLQQELISNAITLLKPHGTLIYATCSLLSEENHEQITCLELISKRQLLPSLEGCDGFFVAIFQRP